MAATEGSFRTTPSPLTKTRVLAVPRSTASSLAGRQDFLLASCPFRALASVKNALADATAGLISIAAVTVEVPSAGVPEPWMALHMAATVAFHPAGFTGSVRHVNDQYVNCQRDRPHIRRDDAS